MSIMIEMINDILLININNGINNNEEEECMWWVAWRSSKKNVKNYNATTRKMAQLLYNIISL